MNTVRFFLRHDDLRCLLLFFAIGFGPISALALTIFGLWTLPVGAMCVTMPLAMLGVFLHHHNPAVGRVAWQGFLAGLVAVLIYDCSRWTLSAWLGLHDFIPSIGGWLLSSSEPNWVAGYLWRYLGNGGGMGIGYAVLMQILSHGRHRLPAAVFEYRLTGIAYGVGIWGCLMITLIASPHGQTMMFPLTVEYFWVTLIGHVVYGVVLGLIFHAKAAPRRPAALSVPSVHTALKTTLRDLTATGPATGPATAC